jgi:ATP-dependent helicase/nuclease subunit B
MHEEVFRALQNGATVITASRRLARVLAREFHGLETARGNRVWNRPDILPFEAFLDRAWRDWLWQGANGDAPVLLNAFEEQALWERIIRESPAGASLLQIPETARQAAQTWQLLAAYRLAVDGSFEASEDSAAFAAWWGEFRALCRSGGWLERARLSDFLRQKIDAGELPRPLEVYVAGFDEMTPQQAAFFDALGEWRAIEPGDSGAAIERRKLRDSSDEIRSAAAWARRLLESNPKAQIGVIVVPDLARVRSAVDRIFGQALGHAFHLSVGPPLGDYPLVRSALLMLEFALGAVPLSRVGMLLRSPFLGGAEGEWSQRALLDAKLRRKSLWDINVPMLRDASASCPQLQSVSRRVEKKLPSFQEAEQAPSSWSRDVAGLLEAFGWPGDRSLSSNEFQTIEAWRGLLSNLASLDLTTPALSFAQIIDWLRESAANARFQVEDEGAPVQVMGMLEAAGVHFDHLWIMGLHDEALPAGASPNPFIPSTLQRQHNLPHCSAARELEFGSRLMERLLRSAPDVVLSYPEREADRTLAPSPLVADGSWLRADAQDTDSWIARMRAESVFETMADESGPELVGSSSPGGSSLFKDMAACPFRAFAKHRLGATPMEDPDLGLNYRDRGTTVHKALEVIWRELGSHARLMELSAAALEAIIAQGADAAVAKLGPGIGRDLEKRRLQKLLRGWLEIEKTRSAFTVAGIEAERVATVSGVEVKMRADRVDEIPGGREIILDYKTGQLKSKVWDGERPDEPQLPLYCVTNERPVAGAAFVMVRTGELRFRGLTAAGAALPGMAKMSIDPPLPFEAQVEEWRRALEQLAANYRNGRAEVDPKPGACDNCGLRALCRIREIPRGGQHDRG